MTEDRLLTSSRRPEDVDAALRPKSLDEFVGQKAARENLRVFIEAARTRGDALDHVLFFGPPGLGKTTLAQIVAREMGVGFRATSGPVIAKSGDLAALLTNLEDGDVLFIDEIHRLNPAVEEILYPAGAADDAAARPVRDSGAANLLFGRRTGKSHSPCCLAARTGHCRRRGKGNCPARARDTADRRAAAQAGARFCECCRGSKCVCQSC